MEQKAFDKPKGKKELTQLQHSAIDYIVMGKNDIEVAQILDVSRETVNRWKNHNFDFISELNRRRQELWSCTHERLRAMVHKALKNIEDTLDSGDVKAAFEILKVVNLYNMDPPSSETNPDLLKFKKAAEMAQQMMENTFPRGKSQKELQLIEIFARELSKQEEE